MDRRDIKKCGGSGSSEVAVCACYLVTSHKGVVNLALFSWILVTK